MNIKDTIHSLITDEGATHKRLIEYVTEQVHQGRPLAEVLDDPYVTNRLEHMERRALLEEPEVVAAAQGDALDDLRAHLEGLAAS